MLDDVTRESAVTSDSQSCKSFGMGKEGGRERYEGETDETLYGELRGRRKDRRKPGMGMGMEWQVRRGREVRKDSRRAWKEGEKKEQVGRKTIPGQVEGGRTSQGRE